MKRYLWILAACGHSSAPAPDPGSGSAAVAKPAADSLCEPLPFAATTPVPEASGAGWLTIDGKLELVVVGDSGNDGAFGIVDPDTGETLSTGKLPLGGGGDDLEGIAVRDGKLYGVTSAGWMRVWKREGAGFTLVDGPYALGPVDLPNKRKGKKLPLGDGMICDLDGSNCGRNYEGLCLPAHPAGPCVGFIAAKADGHLYCLVDEGGRLAVKHEPSIAIARAGVVADCTFGDDDRLWVADNLLNFGQVYTVSGWQDPATAQVHEFDKLAIGFPEVIAVRGDLVYRMSDLGGAPSMMAKFRCSAARR